MPDSAGTLLRIWLKPAHGAPMQAVDSAQITPAGIVGDAQLRKRRPVTILSAERWAAAERELKTPVDPALRKANLLISGIDLADTRGKVLQVGAARLRIRGETTPCELMDEQHAGLREALVAAWGGGAFAAVLQGGEVRIGDAVAWVEE